MTFEQSLYDTILDLTYFTSNRLKNNWKFKYSLNLITKFQDRLAYHIKKQKQPTRDGLCTYLVKAGYKEEIVSEFFEDISLIDLHPVVRH